MTNTCLPVQGYYKNKGSYIEEMLTFYLQMENYLDSKTKLFYYAIKHKEKIGSCFYTYNLVRN